MTRQSHRPCAEHVAGGSGQDPDLREDVEVPQDEEKEPAWKIIRNTQNSGLCLRTCGMANVSPSAASPGRCAGTGTAAGVGRRGPA